MKKAKIALSSIAVLGIAGSIVAFKANHTNKPSAYVTTKPNNIASLTFTKATIDNANGIAPYYYTLVKNQTAPLYRTLGKAD